MLRKMQIVEVWFTKFQSPLKTPWGCLYDIFELTVYGSMLYCDNGCWSAGVEKSDVINKRPVSPRQNFLGSCFFRVCIKKLQFSGGGV